MIPKAYKICFRRLKKNWDSFFHKGNIVDTLQIEDRLLQSINLMACIWTSPSFLIGEYFSTINGFCLFLLSLEDNITT